MKEVKIEVYNGKNVLTQNFKLHHATGTNKVIGTAINEIFEFNNLLRKHNGNGFIKANDNLALVISANGNVECDTFTLNQKFGFKLKFGNTAKSKRKFAEVLRDLIEFSVREVKVQTIEQVIEKYME